MHTLYDHITQHVDNLDDPMQQHTVYTNEVDASSFTTDTTTPCDYNINIDMPNLNSSHENKPHTTPSRGIHSKSKHTYSNIFGDANIQYHNFDMMMHSLSPTNIQRFYNKNYKTLIGVYTTP